MGWRLLPSSVLSGLADSATTAAQARIFTCPPSCCELASARNRRLGKPLSLPDRASRVMLRLVIVDVFLGRPSLSAQVRYDGAFEHASNTIGCVGTAWRNRGACGVNTEQSGSKHEVGREQTACFYDISGKSTSIEGNSSLAESRTPRARAELWPPASPELGSQSAYLFACPPGQYSGVPR